MDDKVLIIHDETVEVYDKMVIIYDETAAVRKAMEAVSDNMWGICDEKVDVRKRVGYIS